jgi:lysyl-tRNA synthetase, class II
LRSIDMNVAPIVRVDRHPLGARLYLLGARIHEWHLGLAMVFGAGVAAASERVHPMLAIGLLASVGVWLVLKDWHDLVPSRRDTAAWSLGLHRRPLPLRQLRRADPMPTLAAVVATVVALVNLASTLTPNVEWRGHALLRLEPIAAMRVSHALAIPAAWVLFVAALHLARRRRRALQAAVAALIVLAALNLLKGLDFEEAVADLVTATLLWLGRGSFYVEQEPWTRRRGPMLTAAGAVAGSFLVAVTAVWIGSPPETPTPTIARAAADLLFWRPAPIQFHDELSHLGLAVGIISGLTLFAVAAVVFRPLSPPRTFPDSATRARAVQLVRRHGSDTLAYFKLRRDKHYLFSPDGTAFLGYRVENGVALVSGDPIGPDGALPSLLRELSAFAERRGLALAALGISGRTRPLFEQLGLNALYIGDEAIVDTDAFSLEGRAIRKVRQSVSRLEKAGFDVTLHELAGLDESVVLELERVSSAWRDGAPERGFSMALDTLRCRDTSDTVVVIARDASGAIRGFLQFVPSYGRAAMSLSAMRRERQTPNGLTEFLIVRAFELMREGGISELSLNFAAFARVIHSPAGRVERVARRLLLVADRFFQIESLYRFNAKFDPRWEPRYFMYEGVRALPRATLAALWAEGQLPRLPFGRPHVRRAGRPPAPADA